MNKRSIVSLAIAASLAQTYATQAVDLKLSSISPINYASEISGTNLNLSFPNSKLTLDVPIANRTINATNSAFVKVYLIGGAKFNANPILKCKTSAADAGFGYSASPQLGGNGTDNVTMPIFTGDNAGEFKVGATSVSACILSANTTNINVTNSNTNITLSAQVETRNGAQFNTAIYNGTLISFVRGVVDSVSRTKANAVIDVATASKLFTSETTRGSTLSSDRKTAALGQVFYSTATTTAYNTTGGRLLPTSAVSAASITIGGPLLAAVNSGAKVFLSTGGDCNAANYTGGTFTQTAGNFTVTFNNVPVTALDAVSGVMACITVNGTASTTGLTEGQITATLSNPAVQTGFSTSFLNNNVNLVEVTKNGAQKLALVLPRPGGQDIAFVRVTNLTSQTGRVLGTLYAQDGTLLGNASTELSASLTPNQVLIMTTDPNNTNSSIVKIGSAFGVSEWTGRSFLKIEAELENIGVLGLIRSPDGTLTNMSAGAIPIANSN